MKHIIGKIGPGLTLLHSEGPKLRRVLTLLSAKRVKVILAAKVRVSPPKDELGHVAQSVGHLTRKSGVLGSIPGLATYFHFSFHFFKEGSCQLLAKVCARSTGLPLRRSKPAQEKCG